MLTTARMLLNDWQRLYRYQGGLSAMLHCWQGTRRIKSGALTPAEEFMPGVDCITFSVVPKMTALWADWIKQAIGMPTLRILIGDCSGILGNYLPDDDVIRVLPLLNYHHGVKLDIFLKQLCRTEYVIVTDDDIFWLDSVPWQWALEQLDQDPEVAVVSLLPFKQTPDTLLGKVPLPMGSCFVIRRKTWQEERLSFQVDHSPEREGKWLYDTGSKAQIQLVERGYKIVFAPDEIQRHLEALEGMSSWMLKIQKQNGNILENIIVDSRVRPAKALRTILAAKGLAGMIAQHPWSKSDPHLAPQLLLEKAETICTQALPQMEVEAIQLEITAQIKRLRHSHKQIRFEKDGQNEYQ